MVGTNNAIQRPTAAWETAHVALSQLAKQTAAGDAEEGRWLLAAFRAATHLHLGFGSFHEYIERLFGYKARTTQEKLRVAAALESLPALKAALEEGRLSWSALRELTRVVVADTEREWLQVATGKSLRQLEELVAGRQPGDVPSTAPDPSAVRHALCFDVNAETYALVREAIAELRRRSGTALDDDAALLEMARHVLVGPRDDGRSSHQVVLSLCPSCATARQSAHGRMVAVDPEVVEMASCDAQRVPANENGDGAHVGARAAQAIAPALRRAVLQRDEHRCRAPGCRNATFLDVHHLQPRSQGGRHEADNLLTLCSAHHRAVHRGRIRIDGTASALRISHADGSDYGQPRAPAADVQAKVFAGLRGLGFREGEVRKVMAELHRQMDLANATPQDLLRAALAALRRPGAG
jgi:5-methylcytosine-specific restriction endonuclease McrA